MVLDGVVFDTLCPTARKEHVDKNWNDFYQIYSYDR
jgi:hypothetical protein